MKLRKNSLVLIFMLLALLVFTGCKSNKADSEENSGSGEESTTAVESSTASAEAQGMQLNVKAADSISLELEEHNGTFFTMKIPKGWTMETTGDYENFGFRLYDPNNSARQIFFYGNMKPFLKSYDAKTAWENYIATGGFADSQIYADAPILTEATVEQFYQTFGEFASLAANYGVVHNFPSFSDLEIVETNARNSPAASIAMDDSVVRGFFTQNGTPCEGLLGASVVNAMTSYMGKVDAGFYTVYLINGITAPTDEFSQIKDTLAESMASFQFSDEYIQQGVSQNGWETEVARQIGQTLSEAYDSYNEAWSNRQVINDTLSQKRSDSTLGYDRLYDTETGDIYRSELGFYDEYDLNREEYANPNLQKIPDDGYDLYGKDINYYIYK